jgi:adenylate cyclase
MECSPSNGTAEPAPPCHANGTNWRFRLLSHRGILVRFALRGKGQDRTQPGITGCFTFIWRSAGRSVAQGATNHPERRLDSWKEIAAFFGRDERTVRRWEKESALPVHRVPGGAKGRVFAYEGELHQWLSTPQAVQSTTLTLEPEVSPIQISPAQPEDKHWRIGTAWMLVGTLAVCAAPAAGIWVYRKSHRFAAYASVPNAARARAKDLQTTGGMDARFGADSIAVLPFTNVAKDAKADYLSDGITESLIGSLAHLPQLKVRSRDSVFRYKSKDVDVQTAGKNLGVSVLVSGRLMAQGDSIEISAELTDVLNNTEIWGHRYEGKRADLILLQQQMAGDIAGKLRSTLSATDREQVTNQGTQDSEAYSLYLKGRYEFNNRTLPRLEAAINYFNRAIAKDPEYALAYSGLADAYSAMPFFGGNPSEDSPKSSAAARKALELDPNLAHPHAVLGSNEMGYDWDFAGGEAEFKKSFELDPNDATAHQWYSENLGTLGGRQQEALAEINLAHQLDPQSLIIRRVIGSVRVSGRQYDEAISVCKELETETPTFSLAHDCLAYAYWGKHMYSQVVEEWKNYGQLSGNRNDLEYSAALDRGFRTAGWKGALTQAIEVWQNRRKTQYESPLMIARLYADLGDKEQAFQWLDTAYREHDWLLMGLNTYFQLDPLRSDPRFGELVRKVGLPQ